MRALNVDGTHRFWQSRWLFLAGALALATGLLWLLLTLPLRPCVACGAVPRPVTALASGVVANVASPRIVYSRGWQVSATGADPAAPDDPFTEPSGVMTFTYTGDALWLLLAPGDYWAYLYATVDGRPANRLAAMAGNIDSLGAAAGYMTLLAPELAGQPDEDRLRWVEIHRAPFSSAGEHTVRLEFWRGWEQTPLRAISVDPAPDALLSSAARRPLWDVPLWPGVLLLLAGLALATVALATHPRIQHARAFPAPGLTWLRLSDAAALRFGWSALAMGGTLTVLGMAGDRWPVALAGVALIGLAGLLRPALWLAALLFALPFAYAVDLPLLPGRALGIVDVGVLGGAAILVAHLALRWLTVGIENYELGITNVKADRTQGITLLLLALLAGWALVASVDVRYPALALREWRVIFLYALIFALTLVGVLRRTEFPATDRWLLVAGWLMGAAVISLIGLWGFVTGQAFVSAAEGVRRVQALYDSANNLALYLDRTLALSLALVLFVPKGRSRLAWGALVAPQGLVWLLTFSKGALLLAAPAMLFVLGVGGLWLLRRQQRSVAPLIAIAGLATLAALVIAPFAGAERFQRLFDFEQGTGFLRLQLWRSAWQIALDHPLMGVGLDQFLYHYRSNYLLPAAWQEPNLNHPHNVLLDWWTRLGVPGLLLGIGWLGAGVWGIWRWLQRSALDDGVAALALGCLAAATAALAHGLIDVSYALPDLMLVWVLIFHLSTERARAG
jgi:putative inorganic carbon (HCO3(-)) transporter